MPKFVRFDDARTLLDGFFPTDFVLLPAFEFEGNALRFLTLCDLVTEVDLVVEVDVDAEVSTSSEGGLGGSSVVSIEKGSVLLIFGRFLVCCYFSLVTGSKSSLS